MNATIEEFPRADASRSSTAYWRVVWVLASKDIAEAVKNRTTLTVLLGLSFMMLTVQALPMLLKLDSRPRLAFADAARTELAAALRDDETVQARALRNEAEAIAAAREASGNLLAVVLPAGWDEGIGPMQLEGYYVHWVGADAAEEMVAVSEKALSGATGRPVTIRTNVLHPTPDSRGRELMVSLGLVLAIILVTAILVPYLFLDEKSAHTLELLSVSPASPAQIVVGKGLAGLVYGVLSAAVLLAFNVSMVLNWPLMIATALAGAMLGVGMGLLVGLVVEDEGAVQLWVGGLSMLFMFPLVLVFGGADLSPFVDKLVWLLPSSAMFALFRSAFGSVWPWDTVIRNMAILLGSAVVVHAIVVWRLRRWEAA